MTVKTPTAPPLPDELERLPHRLRLPHVRRAAPDVIATATSQRWEHAEVLRVLLAEEAAGRDQATIRTRRRASGLPAGKTFDAWEPERSVIPAQTQQALRTLEWIDRHEVLAICGPSRHRRIRPLDESLTGDATAQSTEEEIYHELVTQAEREIATTARTGGQCSSPAARSPTRSAIWARFPRGSTARPAC
jgi:hypothetical protein